MAPTPDEELREAFDRHAQAAGRRWQAQVYGISRPGGQTLTVRVDLTCDDASALAALIRAAVAPPDSARSIYLGTSQVAQRIHVTPSTIRSWLARNRPEQNPFPPPEKLLGRNRWQQSVIDKWQARQKQIKKAGAKPKFRPVSPPAYRPTSADETSG